MEYTKLKTGESYTLSNLFAKDNKIIIPDLQRDYCWGGIEVDGIGLVSKFVDNLKEGYNDEKSELNLGLIYGYEAPLGHIQLCDGQQRITTLFLIMGMINRKCQNTFKERLISQTELDDDQEPYLQYSIRESSLYFLSDLVMSFFLNDKVDLMDIKKEPWYFKDYDLDPSIQSMILAMNSIESKLVDIEDIKAFGEYVSTKLSFMYYNMENRKNGEETFVVINTTGEPLSSTENLKPIFINKQIDIKACSDKWEEWETYFWQHRKGNGQKSNDTADYGLKEFFRWITLLSKDGSEFAEIQKTGNYVFDTNTDFKSVCQYFEIVKSLFSDKEQFADKEDWLSPDKCGNSQIDWFQLLPVIYYVYRFKYLDGIDINQRDIARVRHFFENLSRIDNVQKAISTLLPEAIRIIKNMPTYDITSLLNVDVSKSLMTPEEEEKLSIYKDAVNREEIENAFWVAESHDIFNGEIAPLLQWSKKKTNSFNFEEFNRFYETFINLFHDNLEYEQLDITRRTLLTLNLKEYPKIFHGYTNHSFCWEYSDWKILINENVDRFGDFLYNLLDVNKDELDEYQEGMCRNNASSKDFDEFVKIPELLDFCKNKNIQWKGDLLGWVLLQGKNVRGSYANLKSYRLYLDLINLEDKSFYANWKLNFYPYEDTCAYFDYLNKGNIIIDIYYSGNDKYMLNLFRRNQETEQFFSSISDKLELEFNGERYISKEMSNSNIVELLKQTISIVEQIREGSN